MLFFFPMFYVCSYNILNTLEIVWLVINTCSGLEFGTLLVAQKFK